MIVEFHEDYRGLKIGEPIASDLGTGTIKGIMALDNPGILGLNDCMVLKFESGIMEGKYIGIRVQPKFMPSCFEL